MASRAEILRLLIVLVAGMTAGYLIFQYKRDSMRIHPANSFPVNDTRKSITIKVSTARDVTTGIKATKTIPTKKVIPTKKNIPTKKIIPTQKILPTKKLLPTKENLPTKKALPTKTTPTTKKFPTSAKTETSNKAALATHPAPTEKYPPGRFPKGDLLPCGRIVVPKIVHHTWYSNNLRNTFRFHHYISMLSAYKHIQPTKVMFWHEKVPEGDWWAKIRERVPVIEMKYRKGPTEIHGNHIGNPAHKSDIVRLEAVMEYGGIYTDLDVIVLKSFDPLLKYNTTLGYETGAGAANGLCNGIIISRPRAKFLEIWHYEYRSFKDGQWAVHSVLVPARLAKKYPSLIHTEAKSLHRPNWLETKWLYNNGSLYDWSRNYAVHLWYRFHNVDHNPEDIKMLNTTMGELFRYIYYGKKDIIL
jgi:hypothetical protein